MSFTIPGLGITVGTDSAKQVQQRSEQIQTAYDKIGDANQDGNVDAKDIQAAYEQGSLQSDEALEILGLIEEEADNTIKQADKDIKDAQKDVQSAKKGYDKAQTSVRKALNKKATADTNATNVQIDKRADEIRQEATEEKTKLEERKTQIEARIKSLSDDILGAQNKIDELSKENSGNSLLNLAGTNDDAIARINAQIDGARSEIDSLNENLYSVNSQIASAQNRIDNARAFAEEQYAQEKAQEA